jgi:transcriptional regulator with XRE-family HTH domain
MLPPPQNDRRVIGANILKYRKEIGWTQERLASELDITNEYLCRLEKGKTFPSIKLLEKVARVLHHNLGDFFQELL